MADLSVNDIKQRLVGEFGPTLATGRDEGLERMADYLASLGHERAAMEATLAEMVEAGQLRYLSEPVGGVGAGIMGALDAPTGSTFAMEGGAPQHGLLPASQEHGEGYWELDA